MLVKSLRQKHNWSQQQLAHLSGLNIRTIQRVEKGETVGLETLKSLAAVFEIDVSELQDNQLKGTQANTGQSSEASATDMQKRREAAKAEVKSKKEFYILTLFLVAIFVFFFLPNYNQGENLGALIVTAICFAMIIGAYWVSAFQPFGKKWEERKIKQVMERNEKEDGR